MNAANYNWVLKVAGWIAVASSSGFHAAYGKWVCDYSMWYKPALFAIVLSLPALIWQLRRNYPASIAAGLVMFFLFVAADQSECGQEPQRGAGAQTWLGVVLFGFPASIIIGFVCGWLYRRVRGRARTAQ